MLGGFRNFFTSIFDASELGEIFDLDNFFGYNKTFLGTFQPYSKLIIYLDQWIEV